MLRPEYRPYRQTLRALEHGKHVLAKSRSPSRRQAERMSALAHEKA
jgi:predicted dehydrogenase